MRNEPGAPEPPNGPRPARDDDTLAAPSAARDLRVACPFCGSRDVELLSLFGSQLLTDQYYCRACRTPFEHLLDVKG